MNIARYISEKAIKLEMTTVVEPLEEGMSVERWRQRGKEQILVELVGLLENGGRTGNQTKLILDFVNREKKASTGLTHGIAFPHIRSMQAKEFMLGFARSAKGYDFGALDGLPTNLFFVMAAPPYDDALYLRVFKALSEILRYETVRDELMQITSPGEVIRILHSFE
jgi:mannitol/fructose-specific phosphotransferase system IIA component (Ntr-type)